MDRSANNTPNSEEEMEVGTVEGDEQEYPVDEDDDASVAEDAAESVAFAFDDYERQVYEQVWRRELGELAPRTLLRIQRDAQEEPSGTTTPLWQRFRNAVAPLITNPQRLQYLDSLAVQETERHINEYLMDREAELNIDVDFVRRNITTELREVIEEEEINNAGNIIYEEVIEERLLWRETDIDAEVQRRLNLVEIQGAIRTITDERMRQSEEAIETILIERLDSWNPGRDESFDAAIERALHPDQDGEQVSQVERQFSQDTIGRRERMQEEIQALRLRLARISTTNRASGRREYERITLPRDQAGSIRINTVASETHSGSSSERYRSRNVRNTATALRRPDVRNIFPYEPQPAEVPSTSNTGELNQNAVPSSSTQRQGRHSRQVTFEVPSPISFDNELNVGTENLGTLRSRHTRGISASSSRSRGVRGGHTRETTDRTYVSRNATLVPAYTTIRRIIRRERPQRLADLAAMMARDLEPYTQERTRVELDALQTRVDTSREILNGQYRQRLALETAIRRQRNRIEELDERRIEVETAIRRQHDRIDELQNLSPTAAFPPPPENIEDLPETERRAETNLRGRIQNALTREPEQSSTRALLRFRLQTEIAIRQEEAVTLNTLLERLDWLRDQATYQYGLIPQQQRTLQDDTQRLNDFQLRHDYQNEEILIEQLEDLYRERTWRDDVLARIIEQELGERPFHAQIQDLINDFNRREETESIEEFTERFNVITDEHNDWIMRSTLEEAHVIQNNLLDTQQDLLARIESLEQRIESSNRMTQEGGDEQRLRERWQNARQLYEPRNDLVNLSQRRDEYQLETLYREYNLNRARLRQGFLDVQVQRNQDHADYDEVYELRDDLLALHETVRDRLVELTTELDEIRAQAIASIQLLTPELYQQSDDVIDELREHLENLNLTGLADELQERRDAWENPEDVALEELHEWIQAARQAVDTDTIPARAEIVRRRLPWQQLQINTLERLVGLEERLINRLSAEPEDEQSQDDIQALQTAHEQAREYLESRRPQLEHQVNWLHQNTQSITTNSLDEEEQEEEETITPEEREELLNRVLQEFNRPWRRQDQEFGSTRIGLDNLEVILNRLGLDELLRAVQRERAAYEEELDDDMPHEDQETEDSRNWRAGIRDRLEQNRERIINNTHQQINNTRTDSSVVDDRRSLSYVSAEPSPPQGSEEDDTRSISSLTRQRQHLESVWWQTYLDERLLNEAFSRSWIRQDQQARREEAPNIESALLRLGLNEEAEEMNARLGLRGPNQSLDDTETSEWASNIALRIPQIVGVRRNELRQQISSIEHQIGTLERGVVMAPSSSPNASVAESSQISDEVHDQRSSPFLPPSQRRITNYSPPTEFFRRASHQSPSEFSNDFDMQFERAQADNNSLHDSIMSTHIPARSQSDIQVQQGSITPPVTTSESPIPISPIVPFSSDGRFDNDFSALYPRPPITIPSASPIDLGEPIATDESRTGTPSPYRPSSSNIDPFDDQLGIATTSDNEPRVTITSPFNRTPSIGHPFPDKRKESGSEVPRVPVSLPFDPDGGRPDAGTLAPQPLRAAGLPHITYRPPPRGGSIFSRTWHRFAGDFSRKLKVHYAQSVRDTGQTQNIESQNVDGQGLQTNRISKIKRSYNIKKPRADLSGIYEGTSTRHAWITPVDRNDNRMRYSQPQLNPLSASLFANGTNFRNEAFRINLNNLQFRVGNTNYSSAEMEALPGLHYDKFTPGTRVNYRIDSGNPILEKAVPLTFELPLPAQIPRLAPPKSAPSNLSSQPTTITRQNYQRILETMPSSSRGQYNRAAIADLNVPIILPPVSEEEPVLSSGVSPQESPLLDAEISGDIKQFLTNVFEDPMTGTLARVRQQNHRKWTTQTWDSLRNETVIQSRQNKDEATSEIAVQVPLVIDVLTTLQDSIEKVFKNRITDHSEKNLISFDETIEAMRRNDRAIIKSIPKDGQGVTRILMTAIRDISKISSRLKCSSSELPESYKRLERIGKQLLDGKVGNIPLKNWGSEGELEKSEVADRLKGSLVSSIGQTLVQLYMQGKFNESHEEDYDELTKKRDAMFAVAAADLASQSNSSSVDPAQITQKLIIAERDISNLFISSQKYEQFKALAKGKSESHVSYMLKFLATHTPVINMPTAAEQFIKIAQDVLRPLIEVIALLKKQYQADLNGHTFQSEDSQKIEKLLSHIELKLTSMGFEPVHEESALKADSSNPIVQQRQQLQQKTKHTAHDKNEIIALVGKEIHKMSEEDIEKTYPVRLLLHDEPITGHLMKECGQGGALYMLDSDFTKEPEFLKVSQEIRPENLVVVTGSSITSKFDFFNKKKIKLEYLKVAPANLKTKSMKTEELTPTLSKKRK